MFAFYIQISILMGISILFTFLHFFLLRENYILKNKRVKMEFRVITSNGKVPPKLIKMLQKGGLFNVKELLDKISSKDICVPIVQFNSLEQLITFIEEMDYPIIIRKDLFYKENDFLIEIYNDFRESHI